MFAQILSYFHAMESKQTPAALMPKPLNEAIINYNDAMNSDIRTALEHNFLIGVKQCAKLAPVFKGNAPVGTAKKIHWYLRNKCRYRRDPDSNQIIRLPSYFVNHGGVGDCKTFALFSRSVLAALYPNLKTAYRFANYNGSNIPSHVYTVAIDDAGNEIIVDGCWFRANSEKKYKFALPLNLKTMKVTTLAGIGFVPQQALNKGKKMLTATERKNILREMNSRLPYAKRQRLVQLNKLCKMKNLNKARLDAGEISPATFNLNRMRMMQDLKGLQGINGKKKKRGKGKMAAKRKELIDEYKRIKKLPKGERKAARKALRKKINAMVKKGFTALGRGLNTVALAPIRGAFLAVVAANFNGLGSNLKILYDLSKSGKDKTGWKKILNVWKNVGGFEKILLKAVERGAKNKKLFLSKKAKARYVKNHQGVSGFEINDCEVLDGRNVIGHPAVIAAAIAAATGIIAAMIPVIMQALKKNGHQGAADEMAAQGSDLVDATKNGETYQQTFQGNNEGVDPNNVPEPTESNDENDMSVEASEEMQETIEAINGIHDTCVCSGINGLEPDELTSLIQNLGKVGEAALNFTSVVVQKKAKKNPVLQQVLNTGKATADAVIANQYAQGGGVIPKPFTVRKKSTFEKIFTPTNIALGVAVGGGAWYLKSRK